MIFLGLIITGLIVGIFSSFFGVGGGILIVPTLYTFFEFLPPQVVIATSLSLIFFNSCINTYNFSKSGVRPNFSFLLPIAFSMILGVLAGGKLTLILPARTVKLIFSVFVFAIAIRTLLVKLKKEDSDNWNAPTDIKSRLVAITVGLFGGLVAGMTGLGGGAVLVPLFITVLHIPFRFISAYSNACMVIGTFAGMLLYLIEPTPHFIFNNEILEKGQFGFVNFSIVAALFIGSSTSSKFGVSLVKKISPELSKKLFAVLLIIISIKIFVSSQFS
ncbi:sulfite exporter TauE/SafE family protein [Halobacteriovorax sp. HLS]|uniref:sulfite exporter TauE/SafE family protein n=1 Tax=Halobacteriovorax sp. HLS TaxID=2234000 RepID=UPI000FDA5C0D|nr:sulfite exporter TauE/SafE family protein [Halobacteriovorax sp. HLS]